MTGSLHENIVSR